MDEVAQEKRCLTCKKKLIDESIPICLRCRLKGRNYVGTGAEVALGTAITVFGVKNAIDNK